jgi:hypothetical protein
MNSFLSLSDYRSNCRVDTRVTAARGEAGFETTVGRLRWCRGELRRSARAGMGEA